jgi:hypothetical protein
MWNQHTPLGYKFQTMSFINKMKERYFIKRQNMNFALTGENKSGKSYSGIKFENWFSNDITHTPFHIIFTYEKFFELAENDEINNCCILFDEVGSESRSERFWETESQNLGEILELWGMKRCLLFLTLPNWGKLTSGVRGMIHFRGDCFIDIREGKPIYKMNVTRKFMSYKKNKEVFIPFKTLTIQKDPITDNLYDKYYPDKVSNYHDKMKEMKSRFDKAHKVKIPKQIKSELQSESTNYKKGNYIEF